MVELESDNIKEKILTFNEKKIPGFMKTFFDTYVESGENYQWCQN